MRGRLRAFCAFFRICAQQAHFRRDLPIRPPALLTQAAPYRAHKQLLAPTGMRPKMRPNMNTERSIPLGLQRSSAQGAPSSSCRGHYAPTRAGRERRDAGYSRQPAAAYPLALAVVAAAAACAVVAAAALTGSGVAESKGFLGEPLSSRRTLSIRSFISLNACCAVQPNHVCVRAGR